MAKITFIVGGARSGKSTFAKTLAQAYKRVAFIATCEPRDAEMRQRITLHKRARPRHWKTFEEPKDIEGRLKKLGSGFDCILIDCLTLFISNLLLDGRTQGAIEKVIGRLTASLKKSGARLAIIVANEVGLGIVPDNEMGRKFRDVAGKVNQMIAEEADEVYLTVSGIPLKIKG